jgi:hypothetical protein
VRFEISLPPGNAEEMEDHGTAYETRTLKMREQIEAMKRPLDLGRVTRY